MPGRDERVRDGNGRFLPGRSGNPGGRPHSTVKDPTTGEEVNVHGARPTLLA